ncbi:MAG TPA: TM0106 family RecB-like putative nuclease, partial [Candidatus Paceibacterota bacterium]|nr:TM0106 family RecB-like putative nuclease [Candidatus Paceibacterota bacterium]
MLFEDWPYDKIVRLQNQARVLISGEPLVLRKIAMPAVRHEIFLDIEADPTRDVEYLIGMLMRDTTTGKTTYDHVIAEKPEEEGDAWRKFLDRLATWEDFAIYHYAAYERAVFDKLMLRHGAPEALAQKFHANAVDLHQKTVDAVVLPLYFYTLKDVAKFIGFQWRDPEAGGAESVAWYDAWLTTGDRASLDRTIRYNEDDVRATLVLRDWLATLKPTRRRERLEA